MMETVRINRAQSKAIAKAIYPDVKKHINDNYPRYFEWYYNDVRKSNGKPPLKTMYASKGRAV